MNSISPGGNKNNEVILWSPHCAQPQALGTGVKMIGSLIIFILQIKFIDVSDLTKVTWLGNGRDRT